MTTTKNTKNVVIREKTMARFLLKRNHNIIKSTGRMIINITLVIIKRPNSNPSNIVKLKKILNETLVLQ